MISCVQCLSDVLVTKKRHCMCLKEYVTACKIVNKASSTQTCCSLVQQSTVPEQICTSPDMSIRTWDSLGRNKQRRQ